MKFRKKPVVIEATQWWKDGDHPAVVSPPAYQSVGGYGVLVDADSTKRSFKE